MRECVRERERRERKKRRGEREERRGKKRRREGNSILMKDLSVRCGT